MKPDWHNRWRLLSFAMDLAFVSAALVGVALVRWGFDGVAGGFIPRPGREFARAPLLVAIPIWLATLAANRLYSPQRCQNALEEGRRLITSGLAASVGIVLFGFLLKDNPARSWLLGSMVCGTLFLAIGRKSTRARVAAIRERGAWMTRTVVVGRQQAKAVMETLTADRSSGIQPVAVCGFEWAGVMSTDISGVKDAVRACDAGEVLVIAEDLERQEVALAVEVTDELPVQVIVLPGLDHLLLGSLQLVSVMNEPGLALEPPSVRGYQGMIKRAIDLAFGLFFSAITAPLMALIAIGVRLDSRGPVLYRAPREGRDGSTFVTLKFRTMHVAPEAGGDADRTLLQKDRDDPRITRVGRLLRQTSLDELPQLWNIVRGDMSLVGPRPLALWEAEQLGMRRRVLVRPGLTGLWQVSGRSTLSPEERVRLDLVYIQNWSLLLDISILLRTVPAVIARRGAY